ncbi:circadian clock protein KaiC [Lentzea sp. NBRC 105346]|uniref:RAD55 family ATPase n=1 Tax=Lentzea sp. NBRC 105346 TaxID=3032205 RepID=UPI0024A44A88|nr:ATPase domain-containing protein [Lentzea sp. NBRC 105346]GLZ32289.1 circadian clock protein KaiC [Lentzea sp. NBRC 105346]
MIGRLTTGHARLDALLHGGFVEPSIVLLAGLPGSGKTVLAHQCAFANGSAGRPAAYFSSLAEPMGKLLQFARGLDFFDPEKIGSALLFEDLGSVLNGSGLQGALSKVTEFVGRTECSLVVIDSLPALRVTAKSDSEFHQFVHELAGRLSAFATTSLWLAEHDALDLGRAPEAAVADAVLHLSSGALRVHKLRGSDYQRGPHRYRIGSGGLEVFPRRVDLVGPPAEPEGTVTVVEGVLADCAAGSITVVVGPAGTGKTVLGLQFASGAPTVFASAAESSAALTRIAGGFGWDCNGIEFYCDRPGDTDLDEWSHDVFVLVERTGARRLVVEGLPGYPHQLLAMCAHAGVTSLVTTGTPDLLGTRIPTDSSGADQVVLLQHTRKGASLGHALTVVKTRSSSHLPQTREFEITGDGIRIGQPIDPS